MTGDFYGPQKAADIKKFFPVIFIAAIAAAVMFMRLRFISLPLDNDEGTYAYIANFMNSHYMPYRDIFDHKPPFIYFIYSAAMDLFGRDAYAIRFFAAVYVAAAAAAVFMAASRIKGGFSKYAAALFFTACQGSVMLQGINANTETFLCLPLALAAYFAAKGADEKPFMLASSGFMLGTACLIKETAAPVFILVFIYMAVKKYPLKKMFFFTAGFILPFIFTALWLAHEAIFTDFIKCGILYNFWYLTGGNTARAGVDTRFFVQYGGLLIVSILAAVAGKNKEGENIGLLILSGMAAGIMLQKGMWAHNYVGLCAPLALAAGFAIDRLSREGKKGMAAAVAASVILLVLAVGPNLRYYSMDALDVSATQFRTTRFAESRLMAERINAVKKPGQTLFVYFAQPEIYFLTGIKAPGRYVNMFDWNAAYDEKGVNDELKAVYYSRPDYLVLYKKSLFTFASMLPYYRLEMQGDELELLVKKDDAAKKDAVKR